MTGRRQKLINGYELDVVYDRRWYCYLGKPGICKVIKRAMNKRARQEAKADMYTQST